MFKQLDGRILVGGVIIAVLIVCGIFVYSQWSYNRFADEIGETPQSQPTVANKSNPTSTKIMQKANKANKANTNSDDKNQPIKEIPQNLSIEEKQISDENTDTSAPTTAFDSAQLLSAFGMPEEITSILDGNSEEGELEQAEEHIKEKFGQSPAVEAIIDQLKNMSGRPVELNELTDLFEAWVQVLPEEEQKTRRQLMNAISQLNQIKELGSDDAPTIIEIEVGETEDADK